jgi:hypothetical protein
MSARMIDVRMCDDPEGHDWKTCPHTLTSQRTLGITEVLGPDVTALGAQRILDLLRQEIAINPASDSNGVAHMVPPECEFVVHVQHGTGSPGGTIRALSEDGFYDLVVAPQKGDCYIAVLSSPDADLDELLAGSPEWTPDLMQERLAALKAV